MKYQRIAEIKSRFMEKYPNGSFEEIGKKVYVTFSEKGKVYTYNNYGWNEELIFKLKLENKQEIAKKEFDKNSHIEHGIAQYSAFINEAIEKKTEIYNEFNNLMSTDVFKAFDNKVKRTISNVYFKKIIELNNKIDSHMQTLYSFLDN